MKYISRLTLWQIMAHLKLQAWLQVRLPSLSLNGGCITLTGNDGRIRLWRQFHEFTTDLQVRLRHIVITAYRKRRLAIFTYYQSTDCNSFICGACVRSEIGVCRLCSCHWKQNKTRVSFSVNSAAGLGQRCWFWVRSWGSVKNNQKRTQESSLWQKNNKPNDYAE